jgi:hypothetical protein
MDLFVKRDSHEQAVVRCPDKYGARLNLGPSKVESCDVAGNNQMRVLLGAVRAATA